MDNGNIMWQHKQNWGGVHEYKQDDGTRWLHITFASLSILYSSKIIYLQIDWFALCKGISASELIELNTVIVKALFNFYSLSTTKVDDCSWRLSFKKRETLCFPWTVGIHSCNFQSYLRKRRCYGYCRLLELTAVAFRAT